MGGACKVGSDVSGWCLHSAHCKLGDAGSKGTCTSPPRAGEACDPIDRAPCDPFNTYCDTKSKVCRLTAAAGMACTTGDVCVDYARCDLVAGICVSRARVGETCESDQYGDCMGDLVCTNGRCELPVVELCP